MTTSPRVLQLLADLEASPTPYHAVATAAQRLDGAGFSAVDRTGPLPQQAGRYYAAFGGSLIAWVLPDSQTRTEPYRYTVVGAHTDSPNLRVRTNADVLSAGWAQVGMEIYGGVLLNSWLDRDLGLAGRVTVLIDGEVSERLMLDDRPLLRVPQLAIHLDRGIRENGLLLNPQLHMAPIWALEGESPSVAAYVAEQVGVEEGQILAWDLMAFDTQPPAITGLNADFISSARIDNLFSSFCGVTALIEAADDPGEAIPVLALYDHEEIGSTSATGADGTLLAALMERISATLGLDRGAHLEALTRSLVVSADGAHATNPNYVDKHEPEHMIAVNVGLVVKRNANQRYATDAISEGRFRAACEQVGVPLQTFYCRNDIPCGSTIGPITSSVLGVPTIDVGAPQFAMHSVREMAGVKDVDFLTDALAASYRFT